MHCPDCKKHELEATNSAQGLVYHCPGCECYVFNSAIAKQTFGVPTFQQAWTQATTQNPSALCPACQKQSSTSDVQIPQGTLSLHICKTCHLFWTNGIESSKLPTSLTQQAQNPLAGLSKEDRILHARALAETTYLSRKESEKGASSPKELWKWPLGAFGFPVRLKATYTSKPAYVTYGILLVSMLVSWLNGGDILHSGFQAENPFRHNGINVLTSLFLYGGVLHLTVNMYYLELWGRDLEDAMGHLGFLALFVLSCAGGLILHACYTSDPSVSISGNYGGLAGIGCYYALKFPRKTFGVFLWLWPIVFRWVSLPAIFGLGLWAFHHSLGAAQDIKGFVDVAYLSPLGGCLTAACMYFVHKVLAKSKTS